MKTTRKISLAAVAVLLAVVMNPLPAAARLKVVATLSDLGNIAEIVGGEDVEVQTLCPGPTDPHFLPAKPSLAHRLKKADLLVYNGLELEVGWLPQLISKSRNPRVRPGSEGELDCSRAIENILEKPTGTVDRSQGDVHPLGNPHYTLDPRNAVAVGHLMADRMADLDPEHAEAYRARADLFARNVEERMVDWLQRISPQAEVPLIIYHKHWTYLLDWTGLVAVGEIEHRPGIQPSPRHVHEIIKQGRRLDRAIVVCAQWDRLEVCKEVAERIAAPLAVLPGYSGALPGSEGYLEFIEMMVSGLENAAMPRQEGTP
jgi:zinc/manganese transport system substrate-binding protein